MPFSASNLNTAILPLESKTAMSPQEGGGEKLIQDAGDGSSKECADIGGGTTICFIGVSSNLAGKRGKIYKIILSHIWIHFRGYYQVYDFRKQSYKMVKCSHLHDDDKPQNGR